jgi:Holliday junction DNA helicase RuvA
MIAAIRGTVLFIEGSSLVIECGGIGYQVYVTGEVLSGAVPGMELSLFTYLQVKEDGLALFGFARQDEKRLFEQLLTVSGVGPKGALAVLSCMGADGLRLAVVSADSKQIAKTPGIGTKTAQKIILELKDKVNLEDTLRTDTGMERVTAGTLSGARADTVMALAALGYSEAEALQAVKRVDAPEDATSDEILKLALKQLL